jgi:AhpD family alkylhydroperoxidase
MSTMMTAENYVSSIGFDSKFLELIRFRVSQINQCAFCIDMHFKEAIAAGEDARRLYSVSVWRDTTYYTAEERACLAWAEYVTLSDDQRDEQSLFEDLLTFLDKEKIANLTLAIIQINAWNRLMKSFGIEAGNHQVGQH